MTPNWLSILIQKVTATLSVAVFISTIHSKPRDADHLARRRADKNVTEIPRRRHILILGSLYPAVVRFNVWSRVMGNRTVEEAITEMKKNEHRNLEHEEHNMMAMSPELFQAENGEYW